MTRPPHRTATRAFLHAATILVMVCLAGPLLANCVGPAGFTVTAATITALTVYGWRVSKHR